MLLHKGIKSSLRLIHIRKCVCVYVFCEYIVFYYFNAEHRTGSFNMTKLKNKKKTNQLQWQQQQQHSAKETKKTNGENVLIFHTCYTRAYVYVLVAIMAITPAAKKAARAYHIRK